MWVAYSHITVISKDKQKKKKKKIILEGYL